MKKTLFIGLLSLSLMSASAQDLPKASPLCTSTQVVGLTNIKLEYSRPSVREREIFGSLVPYGEIWRLGANAPTMLTTDTPITIDGQTVKPGKYAIFAMPMEKDAWKIVFNTDTEQWGAGNYSEEKNIATVKVKPTEVHHTESLSITIEDLSTNGGSIVIAWAKSSVSIPFTVETDKIALKNIKKAIEKGEDLDKVYSRAASYYRDSKKDMKTAMTYADKSIALKESHSNLFLKAGILNEQGKNKEAIKLATKALELANKAESKGWADYISENIEEWKK
jgi:hypothetical protein